MEFNLQQFLTEMRAEQKEDHKELSAKVDKVVETLHNHDTRITIVENTRKTMRWAVGVLIAALIAGAVDLTFNHIKTENSHASRGDAGGRDVRGRDVPPAPARGLQQE